MFTLNGDIARRMQLSPEQARCFLFFLFGAQPKEVSRFINRSEETVKYHLKNVRMKHNLIGESRFRIWVALVERGYVTFNISEDVLSLFSPNICKMDGRLVVHVGFAEE